LSIQLTSATLQVLSITGASTPRSLIFIGKSGLRCSGGLLKALAISSTLFTPHHSTDAGLTISISMFRFL
jgi:hypothetical protein